MNQFRVIAFPETDFRCPEIAEIPGSLFAGRYMKIVGIEYAVRTGDNNGFRLQGGDFRSDRLIGLNGFQDLFLTASSHPGNDHRGMRNHIGCGNGHRNTSFSDCCLCMNLCVKRNASYITSAAAGAFPSA